MEITIILIIWALLMITIWATYNNLVSKRNQIENAYGALDAMLKKRYDLLPNLMKIVKAYTVQHEHELVVLMTLAQQREVNSLSASEKHLIDIQAGTSLNAVVKALAQLPVLRNDSQFSRLQGAWNEAEEEIAAARRAYNSSIAEYNNAFEGFPGNMFAKNMNFEHKHVLETPPEEKENISSEMMV